MSDSTSDISETSAEHERGGYRGTTAQARFTSQVVAMVQPATRRRVVELAKTNRVSQGKILRAIIASGLNDVEERLRSGVLNADTLA